MNDLQKLFDSFSSLKIGVIGDLMLDTYMWGRTDRISPEAPVPVVMVDEKEYRIGGAGNVALNCCSLGAQVTILSMTGQDDDHHILKQLLKTKSINTDYLAQSSERITTNKTRIISRNQQMLRLDAEITDDLTTADENFLLQKAEAFIKNEKPDILIFEDYNKGILTPRVISKIIDLCTAACILTAVDPKRKNFFEYKGVDIFKPNLKEVREALNLLFEEPTEQVLDHMHGALTEKLGHRISFITLSEKGVYYRDGHKKQIIASHIRNVADVSGAGDTVIAVAAMVYAVTKDVKLMADIANIAGGLVCEEVGTVAIDKEKLLVESSLLLS